MTGVRIEDFLSQGNLVIEGKAQQIVGTRMDFCFMDFQSSINFTCSQRVFSLGPKRNLFQKVVFWAKPNAQVTPAFT